METQHKVLNFGELLLRMSPNNNGEWIRENMISTFIGGAELNVATALSKWEIPCKYITALPNNSISTDILQYLNKINIDTTSIQISGNRIGIYYLPQGLDVKNNGVVYDRAYSSFSELQKGMIDWESILKDITWVHLSAINPAISENITEVCLELLNVASKLGKTISLDLNYRAKLWNYGKNPNEVIPEIAQYCDVIMGNIWAANKLLNAPLVELTSDENITEKYLNQSLISSEFITKNFPKVKHVANTFRFDSKFDSIEYFATLFSNNTFHISNKINVNDIKSKIGTGDCFMAGVIYGITQNWEPSKTINFASTAAIGKLFEVSDATNQTLENILSNMNTYNSI